MNTLDLNIAGTRLTALPQGALWWADARLLAVSDLHLGRAERQARLGGSLLPPYETTDTLDRLQAVIDMTAPRQVVLVGDSFDDLRAAAELADTMTERLLRIAAGRRLIWVAGNHDPGPLDLPGSHVAEYTAGPLVFRHIAEAGALGEISGHYHPKARFRLRGQFISRPCFLVDPTRVILPAFGTYTGGMDVLDHVFDGLVGDQSRALLTGRKITAISRARMAEPLRGR